MRKMKDCDFQWIGQIPEDWMMTKVKFVADFYNGDRGKNYPSGDDLVDDGIVFLTSNNIHSTVLDTNPEITKYITPERYKLLGGAKIKKGDLVFCLRGSVGLCSINESEDEGTVASSLTVLRPKNINNHFLNFILNSKIAEIQTKKFENGSCAANLSAENVGTYIIPYPPLAEQKRIADFLDEKCGEIDTIRSDVQHEIEILNDYKKSVITEAVTKGLNSKAKLKDTGIEWIGKIPEGWDSIKAKYLFKQRNSRGNTIDLQLLSPSQKFGVIPQSKLEELTTQKVVKLNEKVNLAELKTIHQGDFCISLRSFQGGFEYSEYEGVVSPAYQVFYSIVPSCNGYYRYLFKEKSFIEKMNSFTMSLRDGKNIAFEDFANSEMPVPPLPEQKAIADYLDEKCSEIDATVADKQKQLETLDEYKKSLIFEYVTGKKEVS